MLPVSLITLNYYICIPDLLKLFSNRYTIFFFNYIITGKEFDVPTIVTSGYDLDKLLCTFCNKVFKNDKTLMSHMLHHFGVTPKMASCPICGLTLQKKSYARHLRLHGNVVPEVCQYCQKEVISRV